MANHTQDPTPKQIAAACREIQSGWTAQERMKRLRSDLRPTLCCADGRPVDIAAEDYIGHLEAHQALQAAVGDG